MNKVFLTGDTHGDIDLFKLNSKHFPDKDLDKKDYVIVLGDIALYWYGNRKDNYLKNFYTNKNWTTLWVDGNHENFDIIDKLPITEWNGGKVQKTNDSIIHLMRGEVYNICGKKFLIVGGARSVDKEYRKEGKTWWAREMINESEYNNMIDNLNKVDWKVDYILTHCCSNTILNKIFPNPEYDKMNNTLNLLEKFVTFDHWYFGHYHRDLLVDEKHTCLYNNVTRII